MKYIIFVIFIIMILVPGYALSEGVEKLLVGDWARVYYVDAKDETKVAQMEIYSFEPENRLTIRYFADGEIKPFKVRYGIFSVDEPIIEIRAHEKGSFLYHNGVWKNCQFVAGQMKCLGYHDEDIPFTSWRGKVEKLEEPCCNLK